VGRSSRPARQTGPLTGLILPRSEGVPALVASGTADRVGGRPAKRRPVPGQRGHNSPTAMLAASGGLTPDLPSRAICLRIILIGRNERMNETLVVVPTYNERENLPQLAHRLLSLR